MIKNINNSKDSLTLEDGRNKRDSSRAGVVSIMCLCFLSTTPLYFGVLEQEIDE